MPQFTSREFTLRAGHAIVVLACGATIALGAVACSAGGSASSTIGTSAIPTGATAIEPQAGAMVPSTLEVTLADTSITLEPGQIAQWTDVVTAGNTLLLTGDPTVFVTMPTVEGEPIAVQAIGPGQTTAKVYIDSGQPVQVLTITVTE